MKLLSKICCLFAILACGLSAGADAAVPEKRLALVIGNASYKAQPLVTAANDAALVSGTLQLAGFDVTGARDLDQNLLRDAVRRFTEKVANAGAGAVVFVYFSGYGVQVAGENYLVPVEISDVADIPARALSLSKLMHSLAALNPKSSFIVLDAGRPGPFVPGGEAGGLAWTEPDANMLIAFSTAPGTLAHDTGGSFGAYARALAEMIGEPGLAPANLFDRVRLRVNELTAGGQVPWDASRIETPFKFLARAPGTERNDAAARTALFRLQPMRALGAQNAYMTALLRDTFDAYADFLADYWQDPMTKRVRALLAVRRESITWERTCQSNEATAYWSYLERYPKGPHAAEASRLLTRLGAATTPPPKFARMEYGVPPPLPDELEYIARSALVLDDPSFGFEQPPPPPADFLGPPPREFADLNPPAGSQGHALPVLSLPLTVSAREQSDAKALSKISTDTSEAWVIKRAIDVPGGPQRQAISLSASPSDPAKEESPTDGGLTQSNIQNEGSSQIIAKTGDDRPDQNKDTSALRSARLTAPTMPAWLTDALAAQASMVSTTPLMIANDTLRSAPSMFASASAGLTFQTWRNRLPRPQTIARRSAPIAARSASLAPSPARLPPDSLAAPISPSRATGTILRSTPRSAMVTPAAGGHPLKPIIDQREPPSIVGPPLKPPKKPSTIKPIPPSRLARDPHEPRATTPSDQ